MAVSTHQIGFGGLQLLQDDESYRYGVDAVLLADFARCQSSDRVIDLGTDTGIIPLILHAKYHPAHITGVEIRRGAYELALQNVRLNQLEQTIDLIHGDILQLPEQLPKGSFSVVCSNPPYFEAGNNIVSAGDDKLLARHETTAGLVDFLNVAAYLLAPGGSLYMVHRPSRLVDLLSMGRETGLECKELRMVVPHRGEPANIVLLHFVKGGGRELRLLPELVVRNEDGSYTDEINMIYER